ncbi:uncharacterized protein LOC100680348 isoform X4 [Nasonia vitripennis]|uniref:Uncharacterized protein n=1 Tax=Nasonia vitripennis TaxID=7425 RepID=A0A7M7M621_NASVI|nr:uncharacterized protein LOC100680348 isoform X4 [Nasonia vitripennis]
MSRLTPPARARAHMRCAIRHYAKVGDTFDHNSFKLMCANMIRKSNIDNTPKTADIIKILHNEQKQLQLFEIYLKILHKLLSQNKDDFILDKEKNMKASEGLMLGCRSVIGRLDDLLENALPKKSQKKGNKIVYGLIAGGIGVVVLVYIFR